MVGYSNIGNIPYAFMTGANGANLASLGLPAGDSGYAYGINDSGQVVGENAVGDAFITGPNGIGMTDLGIQGVAQAVNDSGQAAGTSSSSGYLAFITGANGTGVTVLGTLSGYNQSFAQGINDSGQVVGYALLRVGRVTTEHAFVTGANGTGMIDLNSFAALANGDYFTNATGINNKGQIVANTLQGHSYLLTPSSIAAVPEPGEWAMMLSGFGLFGFLAKRKSIKVSQT